MEKITRQNILDEVHNHWRSRYSPGSKTITGSADDIYNKLVTLSPRTEEGVNEIIGNDSWTSLECDECNEQVDVIIRLGQEPDNDSSTACICVNCLNLAIKKATE